MDITKICTTEGDVLVVDSRLIAEKLNINHGDWVRNIIEKYQAKVEAAFGKVRFENGVTGRPGLPPRYALLTEDQAAVYITMSRNSPRIVDCKMQLVKSFSEAKKKLGASQEGKPHHPLVQELRESIYVPKGYFSVFEEIVKEVEALGIEEKNFPVISTQEQEVAAAFYKVIIDHVIRFNLKPEGVRLQIRGIYPGNQHETDGFAFHESFLPFFRAWFRSSYQVKSVPCIVPSPAPKPMHALAPQIASWSYMASIW